MPGDAPAAVLVPFVETEDGPSLIFTRRSEDLPSHGGEISFPGGGVRADEDSRSAALREAQEELGIDPQYVTVLGALPRRSTFVSGFTIAPWVGLLRDARLDPNPREIAEVIVLPLRTLTAPGVRREQRIIRGGELRTNPAYDAGGHTIWGATGRILADLLDLIAEGS